MKARRLTLKVVSTDDPRQRTLRVFLYGAEVSARCVRAGVPLRAGSEASNGWADLYEQTPSGALRRCRSCDQPVVRREYGWTRWERPA